MKFITILMVSFLLLSANDKKQELNIGLGIYSQTQPYKGVKNVTLPSPVVFFDNSLFYIRWTRVGVYFLGNETKNYGWGFSLTLQPRVYGYDDSDILGMQKRENSWEGGLAFSAKIDNTYIEILALTDILGREKNWIVKTEVGYKFTLSKIKFYPSLILSYQSSNFTNYYYGVKQNEATQTRAIYTPSGGLQVGIQTYIKYPITEKISALINIRADRLSQEAAKSPIVDNKLIYSGLASIIYKFQY